jgi:hypothetical protein
MFWKKKKQSEKNQPSAKEIIASEVAKLSVATDERIANTMGIVGKKWQERMQALDDAEVFVRKIAKELEDKVNASHAISRKWESGQNEYTLNFLAFEKARQESYAKDLESTISYRKLCEDHMEFSREHMAAQTKFMGRMAQSMDDLTAEVADIASLRAAAPKPKKKV